MDEIIHKPIPLISFVLPTYQRVAWLGECIQGLLSQTIRDVELIIVDDGSTDGTNELLDWFAQRDDRVKVIYNEKNMGAGRSRNIGNNAATADIIGICDSDDCYPINRTEDTLKFFAEHPNEAIMMTAAYARIDYYGKQMEDFDGEEFDEKKFKESGIVNYFCHPAAAYRKCDIMDIGGYKPETAIVTDDYQLVQDWIRSGKKIGLCTPNFLCAHRVLPKSIMASQRGFKPEWAVK